MIATAAPAGTLDDLCPKKKAGIPPAEESRPENQNPQITWGLDRSLHIRRERTTKARSLPLSPVGRLGDFKTLRKETCMPNYSRPRSGSSFDDIMLGK